MDNISIFLDLYYIPDDESLKDKFIELHEPFSKVNFGSKILEQYWCCLINMLQRVCEKAGSMLIPFAKTYLSKSGFSTFCQSKQNLEID